MKVVVLKKITLLAFSAITLTLTIGCNDPVDEPLDEPPPPDPFELLYWSALSMSTDWYDRNPSASEFVISTAGELAGLAKLVNKGKSFSGKTITLANDINLGGKAWAPIGYNSYNYDWRYRSYSFNGVFDGNGRTINGLYFRNINTTDGGYYTAGLFGFVDSGTVKNLGVVDADVNCVGDKCIDVGSVAGSVGVGSVFNCYSSGTIISSGNIGGMVGRIMGGRIINSYSSSTVSGDYYVGGIVGAVSGDGATVVNSYSTGAVSGNYIVGGVTGSIVFKSSVANSYFTGIVSGESYVGGVAGLVALEGSVTNSYSTGAVSGTENYLGGVTGSVSSGGRVVNCYSTGTVTGNSPYVGGVAGLVEKIHNYEISLAGMGGSITNTTNGAVTNCAALNQIVSSSYYAKRVASGNIENSTLLSNVAFDGMVNLSNNSIYIGWSDKGANNQNGADISIAQILADGTIGGRFTVTNGWTIENGKLPGIGAPVNLPEHLR